MGWLSANEYRPVVEKGMRALATYVNSSGAASNICVGTGEGTTLDFYLTRPTSTGDFHGQAAVIWAATAIMRICN